MSNLSCISWKKQYTNSLVLSNFNNSFRAMGPLQKVILGVTMQSMFSQTRMMRLLFTSMLKMMVLITMSSFSESTVEKDL